MTSEPTGIGVVVLDRDGRVESWNDWLEAAVGLTEAAVRGRSMVDLATAAGAAVLRDACADVVEHGTTRVLSPALHGCIIACPARHPNPYYAEMQQRVTLAPLGGEAGTVGTIVTIEDITDRLVAERDLVARAGASDWRVRADATRVLKATASPRQVADLLASLERNHHDFSVLSGALAVLVALDHDVMHPIIQLLDEPSANLRMHAALALGAIDDPEAVRALIAALDDADANVRFHAIESLGRLGAVEAIEPLARVAAAGDFFLAFPAIDALARIADPIVLPMLLSLASHEALRPAVVDALAALGDEDSVPTLAALINDGGTDIAAACAALRRIAERYEMTVGGETIIADATCQALTAEGRRRVCDALRSAAQPLHGLVTVGGWIGPPALPALLAVVDAEDLHPELTAAITRIGREAVPALLEVLETGERAARIAVAGLLGAIGDRRATAPLVDALSSHDIEMVIAAVTALAAIGDSAALDAVVELLAHADVSVRHGALATVHSLADSRVRSYAHAALSSSDSRVRESAVRIAGYFGFEETVAGVVRALADPAEEVRRAAIEQMPLIDDADVGALLLTALQTESPRNRAGAAHALRLVAAPGVEAGLIAALADADPWVRYFAADSLGLHGTGDGAANALRRLIDDEPAPHVRIAALGALVRLAPSTLPAVAFRMLEDPDENVGAAAVAALAHVNGAEAEAHLEAAIRGPNPAMRLAAASALAHRSTVQAVAALEWAVQLVDPPELSGLAIDGLRILSTSSSAVVARQAVQALIALGVAPHHRDAVIDALGTLEEEGIEWLRELYREAPRVDARALLVNVAVRLRHPRASAMVADALSDPAAPVRQAAVAAIGRIGASIARVHVMALTHSDPDPGVRRLATAVCRRYGWSQPAARDARE